MDEDLLSSTGLVEGACLVMAEQHPTLCPFRCHSKVEVSGVCLSVCGRYGAFVSDTTILLYDLQTGTALKSITHHRSSGTRQETPSVTFATHRSAPCIAAYFATRITIFDIYGDTVTTIPTAPLAHIACLAANRVVGMQKDGVLRVWGTEYGTELLEVALGTVVWTFAVSACEEHVAVVKPAEGYRVYLYGGGGGGLANTTFARTLCTEVDVGSLHSACFSPCSTFVVAGNYSGQVFMWELSGSCLRTVCTAGAVTSLTVSRCARLVLAAGQSLALWEPHSERLHESAGAVVGLALSHCSRWMLKTDATTMELVSLEDWEAGR